MIHKLKYFIPLALVGILHLSGCKKFLAIDPPKDSILQSNIFKSDDIATSAVAGIYSAMAQTGYASGGAFSIGVICGASADEYIGYGGTQAFYDNEVPVAHSTIANGLWGAMYNSIYSANSILEGLNGSTSLTPAVRSQLAGETLFIRAFVYFYLTNMFGDVPLHLTSDYRINQVASRTPQKEVYQQIIADLKAAEPLLSETYISTERIRPNRSAAQAMLARAYLYLGDWENAEKYASLVIGKSSVYKLLNCDDIFLKNSQESIWQLMPIAGLNTSEGLTLILLSVPTVVSLNTNFAINGFEANDKRKVSWVRSFTNAGGTYYHPFKYKVRSSTSITEYSTILRLAELYLIRAEALAQQNKLTTAIDDLDEIRNRAGLTLIKATNPGISKGELLDAILRERRIELFSEWGHRWLDLKRTGKVDAVLAPIKPKWQSTDALYPIPQTEVDRNINMTQNKGY